MMSCLIVVGCERSISEDTTSALNEKVVNNSLVKKTANSTISPSEFDYVGSEHNRILTSFYDNLTIDDVENGNSLNIAREIFKKEMSAQNMDKDNLELSNRMIDEELSKTRIEGDALYKGYESYLTQDAKDFLDQLNQLLLNADFTEEQRIEAIDKLNSQVEISKLEDQEKKIIFSSSSVAKYSIQFWNKNLEVLTDKFSKSNNLKSMYKKGIWGYVTGCWAADAAGAVAGGVRAYVANVIPGGGQAAYAGAIIGGGVAGSAAYHVINLLN